MRSAIDRNVIMQRMTVLSCQLVRLYIIVSNVFCRTTLQSRYYYPILQMRKLRLREERQHGGT